MRDLLDLPIDAAALLPGDDSSEGFDNIAERAQRLAGADAGLRLRGGEDQPPGRRRSDDQRRHHHLRRAARRCRRPGIARACRSARAAACSSQHVFPLDAEYEFRVGRAGGGSSACRAVGGDDAVEITLNGERAARCSDATRRATLRLEDSGRPADASASPIVRKRQRAWRRRPVLRARQQRRRARASRSTAR